MFTERLSLLPETLGDFIPCPPVSNRAAWNALPSALRIALRKRGEDACDFVFQNFSATDYRTFCRTGNRSDYETRYFSQRRALNDLIMAECVTDEGRFLDKIIDGIFALCEESAWQLPAHNSYLRDAPQLPLPDITHPIIDLFAAETGALLGMAYYLLRDAFERVSPAIVQRILKEIDTRLVQPYLHDHFWWMGNGDEPMCNWTSWCTQNILLCVFCTPQTELTRRAVLKQASYSLDCFLKDYGEDGCCNEGAQYYHHAALTLFGALEVLCAAAPDAFLPLFTESKIQNMAAYILHMHVDGPYYINFADCSPFAGRRGAREYLFAKRTQNHAMCNFAATDFLAAQQDKLDSGDIARINLWYLTLDAFTAQEMLLAAGNAVSAAPSEIFYPSVGVFIARDAAYCLAVKGGNNGDSHNHNDTGSVTLYKNGIPFLIDIGVESYTKKTFSPQRYEIWTMQSAWHNLPTFGDIMQKDGAAYGARDVKASFSADESRITMDIAPAYPCNVVTQYCRTVTLQKGKGVVLHDITDYAGDVTLTLMTHERPIVDAEEIIVGTLGIITTNSRRITVEAVPITDPRLRLAWPDTLYRTQIVFTHELKLSVQ